MIIRDYQQNKKQVLALYAAYKEACQKAGRATSTNIDEEAKKIDHEIFNLMILGEAKSGKSTFINAFLGREVVPMDVRQCTSAIIKIKRGEEFSLTARTAGGGMTKRAGYDEVQNFLKEHAAISDQYRSIPITTINNELLIKYKGAPIKPHILDSFLDAELKDNIFNIDQDEYKQLMKEYIKENQHLWDKIVTEIDITYRLPESMQGITIIDSPGVGAGGNVGQIAEEYISNADAIIFVKSLSGQALEAASFLNFFKKNCINRNKDSLFLVFTGKSNLQGLEFARLKEQALEMYKNTIDPKKIIFVDSKIQLFLNHCMELGTIEAIDEYFGRLDEENNDFDPASKRWLKARGDVEKFRDAMMEMSNFQSVYDVMERFARVANYIQLIKFLENIESEFERYRSVYSDQAKMAQEHINDPDALKDRIEAKEKEIRNTYNKLTEGINEIQCNYTDNISGKGIITEEAKVKQSDYEEKLNHFLLLKENEIDNNTFLELRTVTLDAIADAGSFRKMMAQRIIAECNEKLIQLTDDPDKIPAEAFAPNFTESDFDKINTEAEAQTSGVKVSEVGSCFSKRTKRVPYHHLREHVHIVAREISETLLNDIVPRMVDNIVNYVNICAEVYRKKLTEHMTELESEYENLKKSQTDNESRRAALAEIKTKLADTKYGLERVKRLKGELKNYVEG